MIDCGVNKKDECASHEQGGRRGGNSALRALVQWWVLRESLRTNTTPVRHMLDGCQPRDERTTDFPAAVPDQTIGDNT